MRSRISLSAFACAQLLVLFAVSACSQRPDVPTGQAPPAGSAPPPFAMPAEQDLFQNLDSTALPLPLDGQSPPVPLAPPPGPAVVRTPPSGAPAPGSLQAVDWEMWAPRDTGCPDARAGAASYGDLDADRVDEAAVPVTCGAAGQQVEVLVYAGAANAPRLVGKALTAAEGETVHAVQFRDHHLIVTTLAHSSSGRSGKPDVAVTSRWVLTAGALQRTNRWTDPAYLLEIDED